MLKVFAPAQNRAGADPAPSMLEQDARAAIIAPTLVFPADLSGRHRHRRAVEELGLHEELEAGCLLTGHPEVKAAVEQAALGFSGERVYLLAQVRRGLARWVTPPSWLFR